MSTRFGATSEEWEHFDVTLGLTEDLLPVVSDPSLKISPNSTLKAIGKVPSMLNKSNEITGFHEWTKYAGTGEHVAQWQTQPAYGICIQTRYARAIDVDTEDAELARKIYDYLEGWGLPCRARSNSPKFLLCFTAPGKHAKRVIKLANGIIEFLANGQQFIAAGTHPSGVRYEWVGGLPEEIPPVSLTEFELMWKGLQDTFGVTEANGAIRHNEPRRVVVVTDPNPDPILNHLEQTGQVLSTGKEGEAFITCPFVSEHTQEDGGTGTVYYPAGSRGYEQGHFKCLHAHCSDRSDTDFLERIQYGGVWFEPLPAEKVSEAPVENGKTTLHFLTGEEYRRRPPPEWLIDTILPKADLAVLFGESGSGKSFLALDMALALARGLPWNGFAVKQMPVAYICAEGSGGMRNRLEAYCAHNQCDLKDVPVFITPESPSLMEPEQAAAIARGVLACGAKVVFVDTLAQTTPGANENSAEDMGLAITHCRKIGRATGALVVLIHHAGKDLSKGARGWSGLRAAADCEIEVIRNENLRSLRISKQKDGEDMHAWGFKLLIVNIDFDLAGRVMSSCVVEYMPLVKGKSKLKQLGRNEKLVLETFDLMGGVRAPHEDLVLEVLKVVPPVEDNKRDRRRNLIQQAIMNLVDRGAITYRDGVVSVTQI